MQTDDERGTEIGADDHLNQEPMTCENKESFSSESFIINPKRREVMVFVAERYKAGIKLLSIASLTKEGKGHENQASV
jgi:hypothetical protein